VPPVLVARDPPFLAFEGRASPVCFSTGVVRYVFIPDSSLFTPVPRFLRGETQLYFNRDSHALTRYPPVIVAGMLGHSISILLTTYAHFIPTMQDQAAQLMDDILTPIPIELMENN
jgi:hypothetical protein